MEVMQIQAFLPEEGEKDEASTAGRVYHQHITEDAGDRGEAPSFHHPCGDAVGSTSVRCSSSSVPALVHFPTAPLKSHLFYHYHHIRVNVRKFNHRD